MNKQSLLFFIIGIACTGAAVLLYLVFSSSRSTSLTAETLAQGMGIRYWNIEISPSVKASENLYLDIVGNSNIYSKKIGKISEISDSLCTLFVIPENAQWRFSIVSKNNSILTLTVDKKDFNPIIFAYNPHNITLNSLLIKGSDQKITYDFSKLYNGEKGIKLVTREEQTKK